jgi:hypothetical protein
MSRIKKTRKEICFDRLGKVSTSIEYPNKESVFELLMTADPEDGKNCSWIFNQYKAGLFILEDVERVREDLELFFRNNRVLKPDQQKLEKYNYSQLKELLQQFQPKLSSNIISEDPDVKILYKGEYGQLMVPLTEEASCKIGSGTKWCTAANKNNMFESYNKHGPLYVWVDYKRDKKKYQFHFDLETPKFIFMDELDNHIDTELLNYYRIEHPILSQLFKEQEKYILQSNNPKSAYEYAKTAIKGRWYEAEPIIMMHPHGAYLYAKNVIKIDPKNAYLQAKNVIKGRWKEAEPVIMTDQKYSYLYAKNVIKGRWKEAEKYIDNPGIGNSEYYKDLYHKYLKTNDL